MTNDSQLITAFVPCRAGSQRVLHKNTRPFAGFDNGLFEIKLRQLLSCSRINRIVMSTNDEKIISIARSFADPRITIHKRDDNLASSETSNDDLAAHATDLITEGHILWTHVTSPFAGRDVYEKVIESYFTKLNEGYDSLVTCKRIQGFLWQGGEPLNYDRTIEKWPRTQTLEPVYEIDNAVFFVSAQVSMANQDRIGFRPYLYELAELESVDIDYEDDFNFAESLVRNKLISLP